MCDLYSLNIRANSKAAISLVLITLILLVLTTACGSSSISNQTALTPTIKPSPTSLPSHAYSYASA